MPLRTTMAWMSASPASRFASNSNRRANSSTVAAAATVANASARSNSAPRQPLRRTRHRIDVTSSDRTITQLGCQPRSRTQRRGTLRRLRRLTQRGLRGIHDRLLRKRIDLAQLGDQTRRVRRTPRLDLMYRDQTVTHQTCRSSRVHTHTSDALHPLDHPRNLHAHNPQQGVSRSGPNRSCDERNAPYRARRMTTLDHSLTNCWTTFRQAGSSRNACFNSRRSKRKISGSLTDITFSMLLNHAPTAPWRSRSSIGPTDRSVR